ncbi:MAG: GumC family protein, partial [Acidobacteriota bacterium]
MQEHTDRERHLVESWHLLRKHRWMILSSMSILFTLVTIGSFLITPTYRSKAVIQIERHNPNIVDFRNVYAQDNNHLAYTDFYQTQYRLIQSRDVLRRVVERLDLPNQPPVAEAVRPGWVRRSMAWLRQLLPAGETGDAVVTDPLQPWIDALRDRLEINPVKNTHLVEIACTSIDPALAAGIANAVAGEYILFNTEVKSRATGVAGEKLDKEIANLSGEIAAMEGRLRALGKKKSIMELDNKKSLILATLEEVTRAATQARIERARRQAAFESLRNTRPTHLDEVLRSPIIKDLKGRLAGLEGQMAEKEPLFKADYPEMVALRGQIDLVRGQIDAEATRIRDQVVGTAQTAYRTARGEEKRLSALEEEQKARVRDLEQSLAQYKTLESHLDAKKEMRAGLIKRRDETGVLNRIDDTQAGNVWQVETAQAPLLPFRPNKKLNILLSLVVGLGLGVGMAFFFDYLDSSVKGADDLQRLVGIPPLGLIPALKRRGHGKVIALDGRGRAACIDQVTHQSPKSQHAEAYRDLRTTLLLSSPDHPPRLLMVTSSLPREGKTVTAVNIAISLTQIGKKVLLLDADLRRPRIHKVFDLSRSKGLSNWLAGNTDWREMVVPTALPGLSALLAGPVAPNPAELLASNNFRNLLDLLSTNQSFDHVIIDTPPLLAVADPIIVSERVDGVLLVVEGGATPHQSVALAVKKLRAAQARVLGGVLNNLDLTGGDYYSYRYGY